MAIKHDQDSSSGQKLLRMYQILFSEDKCHYQSELSKLLNCSAQTIMRLANEIEQSSPSCFQTGLDRGRRWYRLQAKHHNMLGLDYQELHYLSLCQEISKGFIPEDISKRLDQTILKLSTLLLELDSEKLPYTNKPIAFFSKGKIDYSTHDSIVETLLTCINSQYFCHLHYLSDRNPNGKNHYFIPKKLIAMNNALYVYGASTNNVGKDIINTMCLAIHRIKKLDLIKQQICIAIPDPNPNTFGLPWHEPRTFTIQFRKDVSNYIKERIWAEQQKIEELDNGDIALTITTCSEPELMAWIRSFGEKALVSSFVNL